MNKKPIAHQTATPEGTQLLIQWLIMDLEINCNITELTTWRFLIASASVSPTSTIPLTPSPVYSPCDTKLFGDGTCPPNDVDDVSNIS